MIALNAAHSANLELIDLDDQRESAYWAHVLSIPESELKRIVERVGPCAIDVRRHLTNLTHARRAEWQHKALQTQHQIDPNARPSGADPFFVLIVCAAGLIATMFGALTYSLMPPDEWTMFQREHGCEAVANTDPTIKQIRCPDGRTIVRTKVAGAADGTTAKPMR